MSQQPYQVVMGQDGQPYLLVNGEDQYQYPPQVLGAFNPSFSMAARPKMQSFRPMSIAPRPMSLAPGNAPAQVIAPGPSLFPAVPSAQGNQLGSLPLGGPRFEFTSTTGMVQAATVRPQRNFIGRRMIAVVTLTTAAGSAALGQELYLTNFLVGAQFQLGSGDGVNLAAMAVNATGASFTINTVEPGQDYALTVSWLGRVLVVDDRITCSFTIYGDTVRG